MTRPIAPAKTHTARQRAGAPGARPWIVLLNGVSCSGKSALAREIVERCPTPVIHLSLDHHHAALAGRYATDRWPLYRQMVAGLARSAEGWWRQGFNVIVDTLLETPRLKRDTLALLPRDRTFIIGLHAPLNVLMERARSRPEEERQRIQRQFPLVHRQAIYDLELATDQESPQFLAARILALVGTTARPQPVHEALVGLRPIETDDHGIFAQATQAGGSHTWLHYFPFLHAVARTVRRELRWEEVGGSIVVYHLIDLDREPRLSLYLPPFPFNLEALAHARQRCQRFNPHAPPRILWVEDALLQARAGIATKQRRVDVEYVYEGARVSTLAGSRFDGLRQSLRRLERRKGLTVRPYSEADRAACEILIASWRNQPKAVRGNGNVYRFASLCLAHHGIFAPGLLRGEVVSEDGELRGMTFGGPIAHGTGSLFVVIDDGRLPGLGHLQRHSFIRHNPDLRLFKELRDLDGPELAKLKMAFDPVAHHPLWRVDLREGG